VVTRTRSRQAFDPRDLDAELAVLLVHPGHQMRYPAEADLHQDHVEVLVALERAVEDQADHLAHPRLRQGGVPLDVIAVVAEWGLRRLADVQRQLQVVAFDRLHHRRVE
jgi:hypothetical protein